VANARETPERIGIFGGTFDPVHIGHLVAALSSLHQLRLDRVMLVVAGAPWMKAGQVVAPPDARVEMVAAAIEGVEGLEVSTIEVDRPGPTYSYETVEGLTAPDRSLYLIVGNDVVAKLDQWHRSEELRKKVTLAVVGREGERVHAPAGWRAESVTMPRLDISSSELRQRLARGEPTEFLIPPGAMHVIEKRRLYTPA
jgi:nicotinate-nucleotide adenylyltransferase